MLLDFINAVKVAGAVAVEIIPIFTSDVTDYSLWDDFLFGQDTPLFQIPPLGK